MSFPIEDFLDYCKNRKKMANNTYLSYESDIKKFHSYLKTIGVEDLSLVTNSHISAYLRTLEEREYGLTTISRNMTSLKAYFRYLEKEHIIEENPTDDLKTPKYEKKAPVVLSTEEVERLLAAPDINTLKGKRDAAILELLYATGIKVSELVELKVKDVNLLLNFVYCESEHKERVIPFGNLARTALSHYLNEARNELVDKESNEMLFVNYRGGKLSRQGVWKLLKEYAEKAKLEKEITPYTLRHTFAAHLLENGADLKSVQEMLGHTNLSTTQVYAGFQKNRLREVYMKSHPRG